MNSAKHDTPSERDLVLGVLGGMGPQATVDFLGKLVNATSGAREQDHLHVLIDSNARVPDRNLAVSGEGESPAPVLAQMARGLERAGADFLVMACNTAHAFADAIGEAVRIPFVSIVEEACDACKRDFPRIRRVGLLAAPGCIEAGLYQRALAARDLIPVLLAPDAQARFNALLYRIKLKKDPTIRKGEMQALAVMLISDGAELIVAGCTEVPLVLERDDLIVPLLDATDNLAKRCVLYAKRLEPLPQDS